MVSLSESGSRQATRGVSKAALDALLEGHGEGAIPAQMRYDALARFEELPVRQVLRGGRSWKQDLSKLDLSGLRTDFHYGPEHDEALGAGGLGTLVFSQVDGDGAWYTTPTDRLVEGGVLIAQLNAAREMWPEQFNAAFARAVDTRDDKFASLALAFQSGGVFIAVPDDVVVDEPLIIAYESLAAATFPYTLVSLGKNSRVTVIERIIARESVEPWIREPESFFCGITELVAGDGAKLTYVVDQHASADSRLIFTRRATLGANAELSLCDAEIGGEHSVNRIRVSQNSAGSLSNVTAFFFADADQHVDLETEVVHAAGSTQSQTVIRSAGTQRGQGRYLGNIKILKAAHGANASLRDDALLLSKEAHVDSVPALEIAANDVKAYHGATVGAISEDEIFYAQTRGLERSEAERMIALGFFEPALSRFPGEPLREELRAALRAKLEIAP